MNDGLIQTTESLCPVCLRVLPAEIRRRGGEVMLGRVCPEHGRFEEAIWRGEPDFETWRRPKRPAAGVAPQQPPGRGCPYDCGLCPEHGQHPCTILVEITSHCNLRCPVCFADSGRGEESFTPLATLTEQLAWIHRQTGREVVLQLSGGEPTLYPELPELVAEGARLFSAVQLNTNGLKLAEEPGLARHLARAGLSWVFLQFDGVSDRVFEIIRGRPLWAEKKAALENCAEAGLAVVLVPTVAAGVNDHELGDLVRLAISLPSVRGVHIQPMTASGRNNLSGAAHRLTLPEVLARLSQQTGGLIRPEQAFPPGCEHERCSFVLRYRRTAEGQLIPMAGGGCGCKTTTTPSTPTETADNRRRSVEVVLNSWQGPAPPGLTIPMAKPAVRDGFDEFLALARQQTFSVTAMAFQDVWTVDLERLRGCCVHIFRPPNRFIPFCACNLTSAEGRPLYR